VAADNAWDAEAEGAADEWGDAVEKKPVSLVWPFFALTCFGRHCVHSNFAATSGP
jgi:hypothetical protein